MTTKTANSDPPFSSAINSSDADDQMRGLGAIFMSPFGEQRQGLARTGRAVMIKLHMEERSTFTAAQSVLLPSALDARYGCRSWSMDLKRARSW